MIVKDYEIRYKYGEKIKFGFIGDIHWEAINCDQAKVRRDMALLKEGGYKVFGMGDYFECITESDFRNNTQNFQADYRNLGSEKGLLLMTKQVSKLFKSLGDNLLGLIEGNHEKKLSQKNKLNMHWNLCNAIKEASEEEIIGRHPLDLGYNCIIRIKFVREDEEGKAQKSNVMVFKLWHGAACPATRETKMTSLIKHGKQFWSDLMVVGHWHDLHFDDRIDHMFVPTRGPMKVQVKRRYYGISGSYYNGHKEGVNGYTDEKDYGPLDLGCLKVSIDPDKRTIERIR